MCIVLSPDSKFFFSGSIDSSIIHWSLTSKKKYGVFLGHSGSIRALFLTNNSELLISASSDFTIRIWEIQLKKELNVLIGHTDEVTDIKLTINEDFLVSTAMDKTIRVWNFRNPNEKSKVFSCETVINCFVFARADRYLVYCEGFDVVVRDIQKKKLFVRFEGHRESVTGVCMDFNEEVLVSSSYDGTVRVWNLNKKKSIGVIQLKCTGIVGVEVLKEQLYLFYNDKVKTCGVKEILCQLRADAKKSGVGKRYRESWEADWKYFKASSEWTWSIHFSRFKNSVITKCKDFTCRVWSCHNAKQIIIPNISQDFLIPPSNF